MVENYKNLNEALLSLFNKTKANGIPESNLSDVINFVKKAKINEPMVQSSQKQGKVPLSDHILENELEFAPFKI
jgi:hypothetical protein